MPLWRWRKTGTSSFKEFYFDKRGGRSNYFDEYARRYTDLPLLVMLKEHTYPSGEQDYWCPTATCAPATSTEVGQANNPEWKTLAFDEAGKVVLPNGSIGFRWGPEGRADVGKWNLEDKEARARRRGQAEAVGAGRWCAGA